MILDLLKSSEFEFWLPLDISKSNGKADPTKRWVQGLASTEDRDLQDEEVLQRGIDFSYFLEHGYYNNDHKPGFENKVGQPVEAKITPEGLWTRGFLFQNHKVADAIWELAHALITSSAARRLGFSIQGKVLRRAGKRILKCWVQDIAITAAPINTHTWLDIVKSLSAIPAEMWCESSSGLMMPEDVQHAIPCAKSCSGGCGCGNKALREEDLNLFKQHEEEEEKKALSVGYGHPVVPQSLDSEVKRQTFSKSIPEILNFQDCVYLLQDTRGLSKSEATTLTEAIFAMSEAN